MATRFGFTSFTPAEFEAWLPTVSIARTVTTVQEHHTFLPNYAGFTGSNHFEMQRGMQHHHISNNGWSDIGQHFSIFPDGMVLTGRPLNRTPACILGANTGAICIENVGDFDTGRDQMRAEQRTAILRVTAAILKRFSMIRRDDQGIVYHHWYDLNTGARTNGTGVTKSCPGTAFFGGNTVAAMKANFLPAVLAALGQPAAGGGGAAVSGGQGTVVPASVQRLVVVTATSLNIRRGPAASFPMITEHGPAEMGSILRVFAEANGWFKVSSSKEHWVSGRHTDPVRAGRVTTQDSNGRAGPGRDFPVAQVFQPGDAVFVRQTQGEWHRIGADLWIHQSLVALQ